MVHTKTATIQGQTLSAQALHRLPNKTWHGSSQCHWTMTDRHCNKGSLLWRYLKKPLEDVQWAYEKENSDNIYKQRGKRVLVVTVMMS